MIDNDLNYEEQLNSLDKELIKKNDKLRRDIHYKIDKMHFDHSMESGIAVKHVSKNQIATNMKLRRQLTKTGNQYKKSIQIQDSLSNKIRRLNIENSIYLGYHLVHSYSYT